MQQELIAGDTLNFLTAVPDYPASAGWQLNWRLVPRGGANPPIALTSTPEGDCYRTQATAISTSAWLADAYTWTNWVSKAAEVYTIESGQITIKPNPRTVAAGYDGRSVARKALDAVDAALASYGSKAYLHSYEIAGRKQQFQTPGEFLAFRSKLLAEVAAEEAADRLAAGLSPRNMLLVRFK